jgi:hypothetical protein
MMNAALPLTPALSPQTGRGSLLAIRTFGEAPVLPVGKAATAPHGTLP